MLTSHVRRTEANVLMNFGEYEPSYFAIIKHPLSYEVEE